MTNDIFYSLLKLVSGEELLAKVCAFIENDEVMIVLDHPVIVNMGVSQKNKAPFVKIMPWISLSTDTIHIIRRKDVITMSEVKDKNLVSIHKQYVDEVTEGITLARREVKSRNIVKVDDARKLFERLYNSNESHTTSD